MGTHGHAQVYLDPEEYSWLKRWVKYLDNKQKTRKNKHVFCGFGKGPIKDIRLYFLRGWVDMGLPGKPSLTDIRSAVATYNYQANADPEVRREVAHFMCHSSQVQERFYALHKDVHRAAGMRRLFIALATSGEKPIDIAPSPSSLLTPKSSRPAKRRLEENLESKVKRQKIKAAQKIKSKILTPKKRLASPKRTYPKRVRK